MPRNGSGVYGPPAGTTAVPNTPIESAKYNAFVADAAPAVGKGVGGVVNALWRKAIENPTVAMMERASRKGYKAAEDAGLVFSPETYGRVVDDILEEARKRGIGKGVSGIKRGHDLRARMSRARVIDKAIEEAKNAPGANHTVAGYQTALQRKFSDIANSDEFKHWPKEEQEAVLRVVRGRTVENFLWAAGAFSPRGR